MTGADLAQGRYVARAGGDRIGAAGAEDATRRRIDWARHVALQHDSVAWRGPGSGSGTAESSASV